MHVLQPKHTKLSEKEVEKLLTELNVSLSQIPKINSDDAALPDNCQVGDVIKIERKEQGESIFYYRVVV